MMMCSRMCLSSPRSSLMDKRCLSFFSFSLFLLMASSALSQDIEASGSGSNEDFSVNRSSSLHLQPSSVPSRKFDFNSIVASRDSSHYSAHSIVYSSSSSPVSEDSVVSSHVHVSSSSVVIQTSNRIHTPSPSSFISSSSLSSSSSSSSSSLSSSSSSTSLVTSSSSSLSSSSARTRPSTAPTAPPTTGGTSEVPTSQPEEEESLTSISIFFILVLLGLSVIMVHLLIKMNFHYLPESIAFVILGFLVGGGMFIFSYFFGGHDYSGHETLHPQFFFLVLLPPIIFESGYSLHKGNFFQNLGSIIIFAVFGTAISAVIVGGGLYVLGVMGVIYKLDLIQSFTFGSLISAVDPVATLAIFHALHVDPTLNMLVFGESVLNDAVSIVLTKTILNQLPNTDAVGGADDATAGQILGNSAWQFCVMFFGSALLGVAFALFSALFLKLVNLRRHQSLEFSMWVIFAFAPYFLAEGLHLSGIMAILFCGIVMSHYTHHNLSAVTQITVQQALRTVSFMAETGVFLYLGLAVFTINKYFDLALIIWSVVLILAGRAANIFPLTSLVNCCRSVKISIRMQCIMWYSGLRGAVAFALAEDLKNYFSKEVTGYIVTTTLLIVLFTIVILGGSTLPLLKFLKADKGAKLTLSKTEEQDSAISISTSFNERIISPRVYRRIRNCSQWFMFVDYSYIRPIFIRRFTREEVKASQYEMQQKTVEWYQGLRDASLSDDDHHETGGEEESTVSTLLSSQHD